MEEPVIDADHSDDRLDEIHDHLAACLERPVERTASRWIGEAEAVAGDVADGDLDTAVVAKRLRHVRYLLAEIEDTEDPVASEHVEQAESLTNDVLSDFDERE